MTPREFELMVKGYNHRMIAEDARTAYFVALNTNVHIPKSSQRIQVKDIMKALHPPTKEMRIKEEREFLKEWNEQAKEMLKGGD